MASDGVVETRVGALAAPARNALVGGPFGSNLGTADYVPNGVPVIRGQNLSHGRYVGGEFVFISDDKADSLRANLAYPGDLVLTQRGNAVLHGGQVAVVPAGSHRRYVVSQSQMKLTPDPSKARTDYLYYVFSSADYQHYLRSNAVVTGVPHVNLQALREYPLSLPPLRDQEWIAEILGALDDKIELNRRMNATLEAMARALFQSWFVDFDPVRASAGQLISEGILEVGDGYRAKNSELGGPGLPFIRAGNLKDGFEVTDAEILNEASVAKAGSKVSRPGDVAFTSKGTVGRIARVSDLHPRFVYSPQICYWRSLDASRLEPTILYCWMQSLDFRSQVDAVAGQTDMAPYVSLGDQRAMAVPVFPESQRVLARRLELLLSRRSLVAAESARLAGLRDTLLPILLRGDLAVKHVDRDPNVGTTSIRSTTSITAKPNSTNSTTNIPATVSRPWQQR